MVQAFDQLQELVGFPLRDQKWKEKLLIGAGLNLLSLVIPILPNVFFFGYLWRILSDVGRGEREPFLPEWDDWGGLFRDGLRLTVVGLAFLLPSIVCGLAAYGLTFLMPFWAALGDPESVSAGTLLAPFAMMGIFVAGFGLAMVLGLIGGLMLPVAAVHAAASDDLEAAFRVRTWWRIVRARPGGFVLSFVLLAGLWTLLAFALQILYLTVVFCCLLPVAGVAVWTYLGPVACGLFALSYRAAAAAANGRELVAASPPSRSQDDLPGPSPESDGWQPAGAANDGEGGEAATVPPSGEPDSDLVEPGATSATE